MGSLVGGMMLGIGMDLIVNGQPLGWLLLLPGAPVSAVARLAAGAAAGEPDRPGLEHEPPKSWPARQGTSATVS